MTSVSLVSCLFSHSTSKQVRTHTLAHVHACMHISEHMHIPVKEVLFSQAGQILYAKDTKSVLSATNCTFDASVRDHTRICNEKRL